LHTESVCKLHCLFLCRCWDMLWCYADWIVTASW